MWETGNETFVCLFVLLKNIRYTENNFWANIYQIIISEQCLVCDPLSAQKHEYIGQ